jgi:hypothetical protein
VIPAQPQAKAKKMLVHVSRSLRLSLPTPAMMLACMLHGGFAFQGKYG